MLTFPRFRRSEGSTWKHVGEETKHMKETWSCDNPNGTWIDKNWKHNPYQTRATKEQYKMKTQMINQKIPHTKETSLLKFYKKN